MSKAIRVVKKVAAPVVHQIKTPSIIADDEMDNIIHQLVHDERYYGKVLGDWRERFENDPCRAFEWSQDAFKAAGKMAAANWVTESMRYLREKQDEYTTWSSIQLIKMLRDQLYRDVTNKAKWPDSSTSQPSNYISVCLNSAKAEWLEILDRSLKRIIGESN
jgi:hypothetical protein